MPTPIPVQNSQLPSGFCPTDYQDLLNVFSLHQYITPVDTSGQWVFSQTKPTSAQQNKGWWRLDQFGRPERMYWFAQGAWLSLHPLPSGFIMPWFDAIPNFKTFDGGDNDPLSPISGEMWKQLIDSDPLSPKIGSINARFPLTTGTLPGGNVIDVGTLGGEETHKLTIPEMPIHHHDVTRPKRQDTGDPSWESGSGQNFTIQTGDTGGDQPHNNMPPYTGMTWLYRTSKMFYRVP